MRSPRGAFSTGPGRRYGLSASAGGVAVIALLVSVPYAFLSPSYLREDFFSLHNAALHGALGAAGRDVALARPGSGAVLSLVFGGLGGRPGTTILLMAGVHAVNAVLLFVLASRKLPRVAALAVGGLWAVLPTNSAVTHWPSAAHIGVALTMVLVATLLLWRSAFSWRLAGLALFLMVASGLTYEATLPIALAAGLIVPRVATRRHHPWFTVACTAGLAGVGAWNLATTTKHDLAPLRTVSVIHAHFGSGLVRNPDVGRFLAPALISAVALSVAHVLLPSLPARLGDRLVVVGALIVVLGTLPFVGFGREIDYLMQGDRGTVVSGIGTVLVLVGIGTLISRWRPVVVVLGLFLLAGMVGTQVVNNRAYLRSSRQVNELLAATRNEVGPGQTDVVAVTGGPLGCGGVEAINNDDNLRKAVEWFLGRDLRTVRLASAGDAGVDMDVPGTLDLRRLQLICGG